MLSQPHVSLSRRKFLLTSAAAGAVAGLAAVPARAAGARPRPFGRYGSPAARLTPGTLYVHPGGAVTSPPSGTPSPRRTAADTPSSSPRAPTGRPSPSTPPVRR
ncbi:hypothetical protein SVIOM74S_06494 [Streptomyces violarus]